MSRLLDLRLSLFLFPQFGEKLRQAFRGGIGKAVFTPLEKDDSTF
jgi:hypothetical protein